jgi:TonB family protein
LGCTPSRLQLSFCALATCGLLVTIDARIIFAVDAGDSAAYLDRVERRVTAVWVLPEKLDGRKVILRMHLERSGRVSKVRVEKSSGDKKFDDSAVEAVRTASPFPPVPESAQKFIVGDLHMVLDPTLSERTTKNAVKSKANPSVHR